MSLKKAFAITIGLVVIGVVAIIVQLIMDNTLSGIGISLIVLSGLPLIFSEHSNKPSDQ